MNGWRATYLKNLIENGLNEITSSSIEYQKQLGIGEFPGQVWDWYEISILWQNQDRVLNLAFYYSGSL